MYILLAIAIIILIIAIVITVLAFVDDFEIGICVLIVSIFATGIIDALILSPIFVLDKSAGATIGIITSVDKNYFGSTAIYIKTSETTQEEYCAEDEEIIKIAKENIGNKVKIEYGTRIGLYELKQCNQAPIEKIHLVEKVDE